MLGASVAPTIEPVAKMTAELAPVSACAVASRSTLPRARASLVTSTVAVVSSIGIPARQAPAGSRIDSLRGTMKTSGGAINRRKRAHAMRGAQAAVAGRFANPSQKNAPSRPLLARFLFGAYRTGLVDLRARIHDAGVREAGTPIECDGGGEAKEAGAAHAKPGGAPVDPRNQAFRQINIPPFGRIGRIDPDNEI